MVRRKRESSPTVTKRSKVVCIEVSAKTDSQIKQLPLHSHPPTRIVESPVGKRSSKEFKPSLERPIPYIQQAGISKIREWINERRKLNPKIPKVLLCAGPTGSGKTSSIQQLANEYDANLIIFDCGCKSVSLIYKISKKNMLLSDLEECLDSVQDPIRKKTWILLDGLDQFPPSWIVKFQRLLVEKYTTRPSVPLVFATAVEVYSKAKLEQLLVKTRIAHMVKFKSASITVCSKIAKYWRISSLKKAIKEENSKSEQKTLKRKLANEEDSDDETVSKNSIEKQCNGDVRQLQRMYEMEQGYKVCDTHKMLTYKDSVAAMSPFETCSALFFNNYSYKSLEKKMSLGTACLDQGFLKGLIFTNFYRFLPLEKDKKKQIYTKKSLESLVTLYDSIGEVDILTKRQPFEGIEEEGEEAAHNSASTVTESLDDYVHFGLIPLTANTKPTDSKLVMSQEWKVYATSNSNQTKLSSFRQDFFPSKTSFSTRDVIDFVSFYSDTSTTQVAFNKRLKAKKGSASARISSLAHADYEYLVSRCPLFVRSGKRK